MSIGHVVQACKARAAAFEVKEVGKGPVYCTIGGEEVYGIDTAAAATASIVGGHCLFIIL